MGEQRQCAVLASAHRQRITAMWGTCCCQAAPSRTHNAFPLPLTRTPALGSERTYTVGRLACRPHFLAARRAKHGVEVGVERRWVAARRLFEAAHGALDGRVRALERGRAAREAVARAADLPVGAGTQVEAGSAWFGVGGVLRGGWGGELSEERQQCMQTNSSNATMAGTKAAEWHSRTAPTFPVGASHPVAADLAQALPAAGHARLLQRQAGRVVHRHFGVGDGCGC